MPEQDQTTIIVVILVAFCFSMSAGIGAYIYFNPKAKAWFKKTFGFGKKDDEEPAGDGGGEPPPPYVDPNAAIPANPDTVPATDTVPDPVPVPATDTVPGPATKGACATVVNAGSWKDSKNKFVPYKASDCNGWCGWSARDLKVYKAKISKTGGDIDWLNGTTGCNDSNTKYYEPFATGNYKIVNVGSKKGFKCPTGDIEGNITLTKINGMPGRYTMKYAGDHSQACNKKYISGVNNDKTITFADKNNNAIWSFVPLGNNKYNIICTAGEFTHRYLSVSNDIAALPARWTDANSAREQWTITT